MHADKPAHKADFHGTPAAASKRLRQINQQIQKAAQKRQIGMWPSKPTNSNLNQRVGSSIATDGMKKAATQANLLFQPRNPVSKHREDLEDKVKRQIYKLFNRELECSICFSQLIKPVTLGCGHNFCQLCIFKYLLAYPKKCALCRATIRACYQDLHVNFLLDGISRKFNPTNYDKLSGPRWLKITVGPFFATRNRFRLVSKSLH